MNFNPFGLARAWLNQPVLVKLDTIMSVISEFAGKVTAHNDKIDSALAGLTADVTELTTQITNLQNSAGTVTPEDQALLDVIEARGSAIADKLAALDAITPPAAPKA